MTVVRHSGGQLAIVNSLRMDEAGEAALRALGNVTAVVRPGSFHGFDDEYYVRMFGAVAYALPGSPLPPALPVPPVALVAGLADAPIPGASVFDFAVTKAEAALHLPAHGPAGSGGTVLFRDAVINMGQRPAHLGWPPCLDGWALRASVRSRCGTSFPSSKGAWTTRTWPRSTAASSASSPRLGRSCSRTAT